ncbi:hypothetical protein [uncultured Lentibacter sp.]|jgi:hypothetical protein|uniref:hypothetical protein n=1 Tax=uncultured Lentibacter sp. TaxID=1659309 RepID=UPI00262DBBB5|nr:hypothetical protein [uncultured Lentibacter sp.]
MGLRAAYLAGALALLAGCDTAEKAVDDAARVTAKATVEKVLTAHLPQSLAQSQITPYSECILTHASGRELFRLSRAAITGVAPSTIGLVTDIIQRPATTTCIAKASTGLLAS